MDAKAVLYILVSALVIWCLESININQIFKKNRVIQAKIMYMLIAISIIYPVTNFLWDFVLNTKI